MSNTLEPLSGIKKHALLKDDTVLHSQITLKQSKIAMPFRGGNLLNLPLNLIDCFYTKSTMETNELI